MLKSRGAKEDNDEDVEPDTSSLTPQQRHVWKKNYDKLQATRAQRVMRSRGDASESDAIDGAMRSRGGATERRCERGVMRSRGEALDGRCARGDKSTKT